MSGVAIRNARIVARPRSSRLMVAGATGADGPSIVGRETGEPPAVSSCAANDSNAPRERMIVKMKPTPRAGLAKPYIQSIVYEVGSIGAFAPSGRKRFDGIGPGPLGHPHSPDERIRTNLSGFE